MFRERAIDKTPKADLDRPFRLVTTPAKFGLIIGIVAALAGGLWLFGGQISVKASGLGLIVNPPGNVAVDSPATGILDETLPAVGTTVHAGEVLGNITDATGAIVQVTSPIDGTVVSLSSAKFASVVAGSPLIDIAPDSGPMIGVVYIPVESMGDVVPGLVAEVSPVTTDESTAGYILGTVKKIDPLPATMERLQLMLGDDDMIQTVTANGPVQEVTVDLQTDPNGPLGLKWTSNGPKDDDDVTSGTVASIKLVLTKQSPWQAFTGG